MPPLSVRAHVYAAREMTAGALAALVKHRLGSEPPALVRRVDGAEFLRFSPDLPDAWTEGQTFGPKAEIRWRREGDAFAVLLLTEASDVPPGDDLIELPGAVLVADAESKVGHSTLLWGTPRADAPPGIYRETRIPRALSYPGATGPRPPRLVHRLYREEKSRVVRWIRLVKLVEDREEKPSATA